MFITIRLLTLIGLGLFLRLGKVEVNTRQSCCIMGRLVNTNQQKRKGDMNLTDKLNPNRFTAMSGKTAAILGYVLGESWSEPEIRALHVTIDGFLLVQRNGDVGCNDFIGTMSDFCQNAFRLFEVAEITPSEAKLFRALWQKKVKDWRKER